MTCFVSGSNGIKPRGPIGFFDDFCFVKGVLADTSRQNYLSHNIKIHCARVLSSIFFSFRYFSGKKERVIRNDILMFNLVSIPSIFFSDQINLFYPEFMGTKKAQLGTNLAGLKKQVFYSLF